MDCQRSDPKQASGGARRRQKTPGGIIPFRWAASSRFGGRHHSVTTGDIISFWWAASPGISIGRHKVVLELESGDFGFSRNDTVGVQKQDKRGNWRRIGDLDLNRSRPDLAVIDAQGGNAFGSRLVEAGQRLRFLSHFEGTSLKRRTDAVDRILLGNGRAANLLSVFDPRSNAAPEITDQKATDETLALYELNEDQKEAFRQVICARPVGLLQGPPGTGKTRFIAALAHYAITTGLVRNVLLSSQSHEAVNTAAEAVLTLFRKTGELPSLLRVGMTMGRFRYRCGPITPHASSSLTKTASVRPLANAWP